MKIAAGKLYGVMLLLLVTVALAHLLWGPTELFHLTDMWSFLVPGKDPGEEQAWIVFKELRLPRMVLAALVGAALGVSGALLQSFFKNPLAEPYVLGISSGAGFGAVVWSAFVAGWAGVTWGGMVAAFAGAVLVVVLLISIAQRHRSIFNHKLLLAGVAVGVLFSALTTGILLTANTDQFRAILTWLMGSVAYRGWQEVWFLFPVTLLGVTLAIQMWRELDWLAIDEDAAYTSGVDVRQVRFKLLAIAVLLTSTSVALCGSVAFVGLMVPHSVRFFSGASHRLLLSLSAGAGAVLVMVADLLGRVLLPGVEMPLSLITSVVGAVFFLSLLNRRVR
ncbi:MAG: iron ABC transporter permease [Verrucomicrobiota bacterium]